MLREHVGGAAGTGVRLGRVSVSSEEPRSFLFSLCSPSTPLPSHPLLDALTRLCPVCLLWLRVAPPFGPGDKVLPWQRRVCHVKLKAALALGRLLPLAAQ